MPESWSLDDLFEHMEDEAFELIDGRIYSMALSPHPNHNRILRFLMRGFEDYFEESGLECEAYQAPVDVYPMKDESNYVEPDLFVLCDRSKEKRGAIYGAPDLVVEVVSRSTRTKDYTVKKELYRKSGVKEYWIVDYERDKITVHDFIHDEIHESLYKAKIQSHLFSDFEADFSETMRLLRD